MSAALVGVAALILASVVLGLGRVVRGPTRADRMLAAQLAGTGTVAALALLAPATGAPRLLDAALVVAALAAVAAVAFVASAGDEP